MSPYRIAIDQTTQTIDKRAKHYRNLIAAVTFAGLGSILWAGITLSWLPLAGTLLLIPFCGLYLLIDGTLLNQWRHKLLAGWVNGDIDFNALYQAVIAIATLPRNTVESMLATLPISGDLISEQGVSSSTRAAITAVVTMIHTYRSDLIVLKAAGYTIAGGAVATAAALWVWQPLLGVFSVCPIRLLRKAAKIRRLKSAKKRLVAARQQPDFDLKQFVEIIDKIDWSPLTDTDRHALLRELPLHR